MPCDDGLLKVCRDRARLSEAQEESSSKRERRRPVLVKSPYGRAYVKRFARRDRFMQERNAYRNWVSALAGKAPQLIGEFEDIPALVITVVAGRPLSEVDLPPVLECGVHRAAGALLASWHGAGPARSELGFTKWLAERGEQWLFLADDLLDGMAVSETRAHLRALADIESILTVPCHLDFTPQNLLYDPHRGLSLIDFEHSRYDLPARDLVRLSTRVWPGRPDLKRSFLETYGDLTPIDSDLIEHCSYLDYLTAAVRCAGRYPTRGASPPRTAGNVRQ